MPRKEVCTLTATTTPLFFCRYCLRPQIRNNLLSPLSSQRPAPGHTIGTGTINVEEVWKKGGHEQVCPNTAVRARAARGHQLERLLCGKDAEAEEEATQEPNEGPQGEVPSEPLMSPNVLIFPPQSQNLK